MQTRSKLKPGQKESRKLVALYGSRPVCLRYRYDEQLQKRFKTVEPIVEETPWTPKPTKLHPFRPEEIVGLKIAYDEVGRGKKCESGRRKAE
jgi:hypothetical protein